MNAEIHFDVYFHRHRFALKRCRLEFILLYGLYHVGGGVSAPQLVFAPDPEFSDEARRAKYQGVCVVSLIVDAQGNPQRVQVVRHLGMGLDEKAVEAVRQYKFKPATLQGKPVPVEVNIEVNFRIY